MEMHTMNDEFLKDLHELERSDEDRSKLLMKGIKKTLAERQSAGRLERWLKFKRKKKIEAWHSSPQETESPKQAKRSEHFRDSAYRESSYETRTE
ncbi:hypothetical protein [Saccharibacillus kuerlensis]|uniref:Uncharacterized protein n=1 Tax=Saccharibacillus kuerlensis TaxID=459527 RepID=A0ABQ2L529_9BACL|nr:hypothetical protein [Saccharibacillus kuerlensis]GGO03793.1 hypothetical protein GCM10010969_28350 [Saccharibacillus kuerlensis]